MSACPRCGRSFARGRFCTADGCALVEERPASGVAASGVAAASVRGDVTDDDARIGTEVDGFRIDGVLGRGASGTVYRATQLALARPVALKVLHVSLAHDAAMVARLHREARALARLQHPGVVAVLAVGQCSDGAPYLAMEHIAGITLEHALEAGPLAPRRAAAIGAQIAAALAETHAAGVVHRDLKPANVMLETVGGRERAVLVDFGIARALDDSPRLTAGGVAIGTPHYMAPEQVLGGAVDGRTDLYALGAVLYRMVTGAVPFDGAGLPVMMAHLHRVPEPPRARVPGLPAALDAIILHALAKRPDERVASAGAMAAALREVAGTGVNGADASNGANGAASPPAMPARGAGASRMHRVSSGLPSRPVRVTTDLFGTAVWQSGRRPRRRGAGGWMLAALAIAAMCLGARWWAERDAGATSLAAAIGIDRGLELGAGDERGGPLPRRFLVVTDGIALRASLPASITAGAAIDIELELWNAEGEPVTAPEAVVTVRRPDGGVRGLGAPSLAPGRYRFRAVFPRPGRHLLQVFVLEGDATLAVPFEVAARRDNV